MNPKIEHHFGGRPIVWVPMWGLSKLRQRGGEFAGSIPGNALWYDRWYDRAMSEECADKLCALGFNLVILPFSLGGTAEQEASEHENFARMTKLLHERKMVSLPYLQYQNLLQEQNWPAGTTAAVMLDNTRTCYAYWRQTACQSSEQFRKYFRDTIAAAVRLGADGIWIDNNYLKPCRCELCQKNFAEYAGDDRLEIPPQFIPTDPVAQLFFEFNSARNMALHRELKNHLESLLPLGLFCSNPGIYRGRNYLELGVDLKDMLEINDIIYLENKLSTNEDRQGHPIGNFHGFLAALGTGAKGVAGAWKRPDYDATSRRTANIMPDSSEAEQIILEAVTCGGALGAFWAVREMPDCFCTSGADKLKMYFELPEMTAALKKTLSYAASLPIGPTVENLAPVGVLYHRDSMRYDFQRHQEALFGVEEMLTENGIPYQVVFSENELPALAQLIIPEVRLLSERDITKLRAFPGRLLIIGSELGRYDEKRRCRLDSILADWMDISCYTAPAEPRSSGRLDYFPGAVSNDGEFSGMQSGTLNRPRWDRAALLQLIVRPFTISRPGIAATLLRSQGHKLLQLFSYAANPAVHTLTLRGLPAGKAVLHLPGHAPREVETGTEFVLPDFRRHALLQFQS
jgi:hypothetical protein